jgi:hypothetical protein
LRREHATRRGKIDMNPRRKPKNVLKMERRRDQEGKRRIMEVGRELQRKLEKI